VALEEPKEVLVMVEAGVAEDLVALLVVRLDSLHHYCVLLEIFQLLHYTLPKNPTKIKSTSFLQK